MRDPGTDPLSPLARKIMAAGAYDALVVTGEKSALARELLDNVTPDQLLAVPATNLAAAYAMLAALWLRHDALNACHEIVQKEPEKLLGSARHPHGIAGNSSLNIVFVESVENDKGRDAQNLREMTDTLSFWHAIMHRREGDFGNSKYWFARCRNHPSFATLSVQAASVVSTFPADKSLLRLIMNGWDPNAFVDLVEQVHDEPDDPRHKLAITLQRLEWQTLFDHCTRAAAG